MSLAQNILDGAFTTLLATNGESLTRGTNPISALVSRNLDYSKFNITPGIPNAEISLVEFSASGANVPIVGENFIDAANNSHRVVRYKRIASWYRCECITSKQATND